MLYIISLEVFTLEMKICINTFWPPSGEGSGTPLQYSCLENPMDGGAWWAAVHGVTKSRIRLSNFTFTFHFHALEKAMATHSSTLAWKIPWMEEPGVLQSMGSLRVGHDWVTSLSHFTFMHWRRKWQPTPVFLPGESQGRGSLVGCRLWGRRVGHDWSDIAAAAAISSPNPGVKPTIPALAGVFFATEPSEKPLFRNKCA